MKKVLLIALVALGFLMAGAPKSEARVFLNIGIGAPFGYYPYYQPYYGYGCGYYPYAYPGYFAPRIYYSNFGRYYWYHGRRVYVHRHY
jgi:hypothetical protein